MVVRRPRIQEPACSPRGDSGVSRSRPESRRPISVLVVGFHPLHHGLDAFAVLLDEHAAKPGGIQREASPGDPKDAGEATGRLARLLVADAEDVAGHEQGPDDRVAQGVLRGDGVAGPILRDIAVVAESGHDGPGGTHQADGHAQPGCVVVSRATRQEARLSQMLLTVQAPIGTATMAG